MGSKRSLTKLPVNRKVLFFLLAAIILAFIAVGGMMYIRQMYKVSPVKEAAGIPVSLVAAARGDVVKSLKYNGTIESYSVSSPAAKISERVERVAVAEGDRVSTGDLLVSLSSTELQGKLNTLSRRVETAEINARHWDNEAQVYKTLLDEKAISQHEYDSIVYKRDSAAAALREAGSLLAEARIALNNTVIRSEIAGIVSSVNIEAGNQAMPGQPLVSIVDPDNLKVIIHVIESDLSLINSGMSAKVYLTEGNQINASVGQTYPTLDIKTRSATVEIPLPSEQVRKQRIFPGMSADVQLVLAQQKDVLLLPLVSVVKQKNKSYVFLIKDGKAVQTEIAVGISDGDKVEIISGLNEGDKAVLRPPSDLRNGQTVYLFKGGISNEAI